MPQLDGLNKDAFLAVERFHIGQYMSAHLLLKVVHPGPWPVLWWRPSPHGWPFRGPTVPMQCYSVPLVLPTGPLREHQLVHSPNVSQIVLSCVRPHEIRGHPCPGGKPKYTPSKDSPICPWSQFATGRHAILATNVQAPGLQPKSQW